MKSEKYIEFQTVLKYVFTVQYMKYANKLINFVSNCLYKCHDFIHISQIIYGPFLYLKAWMENVTPTFQTDFIDTGNTLGQKECKKEKEKNERKSI